jgi:selenocysteine-specific elongation factor
MRSLILGTAGHIDHGKTALVRALTGVDTDRLKEEKERGITVDLGFAELVAPGGALRFGIVDVPGHEGFIRNMLAGATGMDLVLLVVAADEGIMPQTREHLSIVELLGVPRLVVALAKADLVESDWLELVAEEVREELAGTPYPDAPIVSVSSVTGEGLEELVTVLTDEGAQARSKEKGDLGRLPLDRVFTIKGAGTIVTGTLWTGTLRIGDRGLILPGEVEARVRSLQLHGREVEEASAGARVAVGLTGTGISHNSLSRGQNLVTGEGWAPSWMLDCRVKVLKGTGWALEQGQRVRVHLGTAEVLARVVILGEEDGLGPGQDGWAQLRLEGPLLARGRDHLVIRSYSPVTTIAGGQVAEVHPQKRRRLRGGEGDRLRARIGLDPRAALEALLVDRGWAGVPGSHLPQLLGFPPETAEEATRSLVRESQAVRVEGRLFSKPTWEGGRERLLKTVSSFHEGEPLRPGMPLQEVRQCLPPNAGQGLVESILRGLAEEGVIRSEKGLARLAGFSPRLTPEQEALRGAFRKKLEEAGLAVPGPTELASETGVPLDAARGILGLMETQGELVALDGELFVPRQTVLDAGTSLVDALGGRSGLGPTDFREVLGVSRKYLLPLLRHFDTLGVTTRMGQNRTVAKALPEEWGT